jgi:ribosome-associated heat shock protein Hsp15
MAEQRLDKWLWCARLAKTRTGAARLVAAGKVRINGERARKPSRLVHTGDVVTATPIGGLKVLRVIDIAERRVSASLSQTLYEDLTPEDAPPPERTARFARTGKRPTKRDRRRLDAFRSGDG